MVAWSRPSSFILRRLGKRAAIVKYPSAHSRRCSFPLPTYVNPSEFMLELVNVDFAQDRRQAEHRLNRIVDAWARRMDTQSCETVTETIAGVRYPPGTAFPLVVPPPTPKIAVLLVPFILLHRNFIKSHRDVVAYGVRLFMYFGSAVSHRRFSRKYSFSYRSGCLDGNGVAAPQPRSVNNPAQGMF
jgi:hypothetical protein